MGRDDDMSSVLSVNIPKRDASSKSTGKSGRSTSQDDQLARARNVALSNRRIKLKSKLEERLAELRRTMGDLNSDQMERVVKHLVETEDHHRTKLAHLVEKYTAQLAHVHDELKALRVTSGPSSRKHVGSLSDVSRV
eukprot:413392-Prymnesium_polylepis.4